MPFQIPTRDKIIAQLKDYVRGNLTALDTSKNMARYTSGMTIALGSALHDWYVRLAKYINKDAFWQTCSAKYLLDERAWWHKRTGLSRHPETPATGYAVAFGSVGAKLLKGSTAVLGGRRYSTQNSGVVTSQTLVLSSLKVINDLAIAETTEPHFLATGLEVEITDAQPASFNGMYQITVTADNEFTYVSTAIGIATSAPKVSANFVRVLLNSEGLGQSQNIDNGVKLSLEITPTGLEPSLIVDFSTVSGGSDLEDVEDFRDRIGEALSYQRGIATDIEWASLTKNVPGVTRAWVRNARLNPPSGWPLPGQTKIAFMRDNDADPFPSLREIEDVKRVLLHDPQTKLLLAHVIADNIMIISPIKKTVDFEFTNITPNTAEMGLAIAASLKQYFAENVYWGADYPNEPDATLHKNGYDCAIMAAVTPTGAGLTSFTLAQPLGDVSKAPDELLVLGDVRFV